MSQTGTERVVPLKDKVYGYSIEWAYVLEAVEGLKKDDEISWNKLIENIKRIPMHFETSDELCSVLSDYRVEQKELIDARFGKY